jgi:hypothetical protein
MLAEKEVAFARLDICAACEHLFRPTFTCRKCGCFMKAKARIASQHCPVHKWEAVPTEGESHE